MAHSGGIIAAGIGKGRIPWFKKDISVCLRNELLNLKHYFKTLRCF